MKKLFLIIALAIASLGASAQTAKPVLYAGKFDYNIDNVSYEERARVRSAILNAFVATNRFEILDKDTEEALDAELNRRASENAMADSTARNEEIVEIAADYIITGYVTQCEAVPPTGDSKMYTGNVSFTIKVNEVKTKKLIAQGEIAIKDMRAGMGYTDEEAITDALKQVPGQIKDFVDKNFKLKAVILGEEYTAKGSKLATCIITLGSDHGISKGQKLDVFVVNMIAGRQTNKVIGKIQVEEVLAGDLSQCKAIEGADVMLTALNEYLQIRDSQPDKAKELQVQTAEKTGAGKFFRDMGNSLIK